jgi:hypothetical protein
MNSNARAARLRRGGAWLAAGLCLLGIGRGFWFHFWLERDSPAKGRVDARYAPAAGVLAPETPLGLVVISPDPGAHERAYPLARLAIAPEPLHFGSEGLEYVLADVTPAERLDEEMRLRGYSLAKLVGAGVGIFRRISR